MANDSKVLCWWEGSSCEDRLPLCRFSEGESRDYPLGDGKRSARGNPGDEETAQGQAAGHGHPQDIDSFSGGELAVGSQRQGL